MVEPDRLLMSV